MKSIKFCGWARLVVGIICFIVAIVYVCQLKHDSSTLEKAVYELKQLIAAAYWFTLSSIWLTSVVIINNQNRIDELEKRIEVLENKQEE